MFSSYHSIAMPVSCVVICFCTRVSGLALCVAILGTVASIPVLSIVCSSRSVSDSTVLGGACMALAAPLG